MMAATINGTTFMLVRVTSGAAVNATVTYNATTRTAVLQPTTALGAITTYRARVKGGTAGVKDAAGNSLLSDVTWTFTTGL
jgi:hypothetical protein